MTWIQLALAFLRLFNWAMTKIDESQWKRFGKLEELNDQRAIYDAAMRNIDKSIAEANAATKEERQRSLDSDL